MLKIGIEILGPHHLDPRQHEYDLRRARRILGSHGILLLQFTAAEVLRDPDAVIDAILRVIADLGLQLPA